MLSSTEPAARRRLEWPADRLAMVGILALAFGLRLWRLGDKNLWWDEALALWAVRQPLAALTAWTAGDVHPPLFFWALWLWRRGVGETEFALRMLPALWGVITVALAYALGRRAGGRRAGGLAALLLAVSPFAVWWSGELRMYALAGLWVTLVAYATQRWLEDAAAARGLAAGSAPPRPDRWLPWVLLATVAILHSLYLGAAALVALNLAVGLAWLRGGLPARRLVAWAVAQLLAGLAFLPWWRYAAGHMQSWTSLPQPTTPWEVLRLGATLMATGRSTALAEAAWPTLLFWTAALIAAALAWRNRRKAALRQPAVLVFLALLPPAAIWAATQPRSLFYSPGLEARYYLPFAAPVYALVAMLAAGGRLAPRPVAPLLAAGLLLPLLGGLPDHYAPRRLRDDLQSLVLVLWSQARPDDALLLVSGDRYPLLEAAYGRWSPGEGAMQPGALPPIRPFPGKSAGPLPAGWEAGLAAIVRDHPRVWLVEIERHWQDPEGKVGAWLTTDRRLVLSETFGPHRLSLFAASGVAPPAVERVDPHWPGCREQPNGVAQVLACQPAVDVRPGDELSLTLFSHPASARELRLDALDGAAAAPVARWVAAAGASTTSKADRQRVSLSITERLPSGRYAFFAEGRVAPIGRPVELRSRLPGPAPWPVGWRGTSIRFFHPSGEVRLSGISLTGPPLGPGSTVAVDLRWDLPAPASLTPSPTVFVHLLGPPRPDGSVVWATGDGPPLADRWPVAPGPLFDRHLLAIDPDAPPGRYQIEVGLYDAIGGERWLVEGPGSDAAARRFVGDPADLRRSGP
ncbi:MAG: glycosyltransferase family 39 protein [Ardenticatenia bacterium]|nr:glycosyltransferase family 39 protein [Ardenticatenia bacterium]